LFYRSGEDRSKSTKSNAVNIYLQKSSIVLVIKRNAEGQESRSDPSPAQRRPCGYWVVIIIHVFESYKGYAKQRLTLYRMVMPIGTPFLKEKINN